jgi:hypothetical protein
VFAFLDHD